MPGDSQLSSPSKAVGASITCKRCKNKVSHAIKCVNCVCAFHLSCAKLVPNIQFINDSSVICCDIADANVSETNDNVAVCEALKEFADSNNKIDIRLVMYILQQKDVIISELREKNEILRKHNDLLASVQSKDDEAYTTVNEVPSARSQEMLIDSEDTSKNKSVKFIKKTTSDSIVASKYKNNIDQENAVHKVIEQQHALPHTSQSNVSNDLWTDVVKRKQRNHHTLVGKKVSTDSNVLKVKGVPKTVALHVYRLAPSTTTEELVNFLKADIPVISCEKLNSRHPDQYSSFKIEISEIHLKSALNPEIWPDNACVRRFFQPRQRTVNG